MSNNSDFRLFSRASLKPSIHGRLGRMSYIALVIFWSYVAVLPTFIVCGAELFDVHLHLSRLYPVPEEIQLTAFLLPFFIYAIISIAAVTIRRLHDINLRGGWLLIAILLYVLLFELAERYLYQLPLVILFLPLFALGIITIIPGNSSINRFGEVTASISRMKAFLVFCGAVVLCAGILPLLYFLLTILALAQMTGHC